MCKNYNRNTATCLSDVQSAWTSKKAADTEDLIRKADTCPIIGKQCFTDLLNKCDDDNINQDTCQSGIVTKGDAWVETRLQKALNDADTTNFQKGSDYDAFINNHCEPLRDLEGDYNTKIVEDLYSTCATKVRDMKTGGQTTNTDQAVENAKFAESESEFQQALASCGLYSDDTCKSKVESAWQTNKRDRTSLFTSDLGGCNVDNLGQGQACFESKLDQCAAADNMNNAECQGAVELEAASWLGSKKSVIGQHAFNKARDCGNKACFAEASDVCSPLAELNGFLDESDVKGECTRRIDGLADDKKSSIKRDAIALANEATNEEGFKEPLKMCLNFNDTDCQSEVNRIRKDTLAKIAAEEHETNEDAG